MALTSPFEIGNVYKRQELHEQFGGQRYGGISTPAAHPFVMCFTGETAKRHGYKDWWDTEAGVLHYYGEGQSAGDPFGQVSFGEGELLGEGFPHCRDVPLAPVFEKCE